MKNKPKMITANLNFPEGEYNHYVTELHRESINQLLIQLEKLIIDGLKNHGYEFDSREKLENFVKDNCDCIVHGDVKTYTVKGVPFLGYKEEKSLGFPSRFSNSLDSYQYVISSYKFL